MGFDNLDSRLTANDQIFIACHVMHSYIYTIHIRLLSFIFFILIFSIWYKRVFLNCMEARSVFWEYQFLIFEPWNRKRLHSISDIRILFVLKLIHTTEWEQFVLLVQALPKLKIRRFSRNIYKLCNLFRQSFITVKFFDKLVRSYNVLRVVLDVFFI